MDKDLIIEACQFYINSLKQKNSELEEKINRSSVGSVRCKSITLYTTRWSSCLNNSIVIFNKETDVTNTSQNSTSSFTVQNTSTNEMPWSTYTFETETEVSKVSVNRPHCIDMKDAYIKITDCNGNTLYQSTRICSGMGTKSMYTYDIQNVDPRIV
jgi:hypothetical protein